MDVSRSQMTNSGNRVTLTDPDFPLTVTVRTDPGSERPLILSITVDSRDGTGITSTLLSQIPVRQVAGVAASALLGEGEAQLRMLARPKPPGSRGWPEDHFSRVARVVSWARATGRPGGAAGAISDFWAVNRRTARRWIARLRSVSDRP